MSSRSPLLSQGNTMQQQQLHIVFSHRAGGYVWFDLLGPAVLIAAYQASLEKPCYHRDRPDQAAYCVGINTFDGVAGLMRSVPLVSYVRKDGKGIGWIPDLDDYRSLMLMANQAANQFVADAFIKQALATLNQPVPKFKDAPVTQNQPPAGESSADDALAQFAPPLDTQ